MAKMKFMYGVVNSAKSMTLIANAYNYNQRRRKTIVLKPVISNRGESDDEIYSRTGLKTKCTLIHKETNICNIKNIETYHVIFVDEAQFLTRAQVNQLREIASVWNIPVNAYGLRNNFKMELFEGSKRLFELSDEFIEIPSVCHCGNDAKQNLRVIDGEITFSGKEIMVGKEKLYVALCNTCTMKKDIGPPLI